MSQHIEGGGRLLLDSAVVWENLEEEILSHRTETTIHDAFRYITSTTPRVCEPTHRMD